MSFFNRQGHSVLQSGSLTFRHGPSCHSGFQISWIFFLSQSSHVRLINHMHFKTSHNYFFPGAISLPSLGAYLIRFKCRSSHILKFETHYFSVPGTCQCHKPLEVDSQVRVCFSLSHSVCPVVCQALGRIVTSLWPGFREKATVTQRSLSGRRKATQPVHARGYI